MKNDLLTITELARLRKVTSETLRHYDRIGLLKPAFIDPNNGYRYYSIRQYEKLGTIKELRNLGMSLDEIITYFDDRNLSKSIDMLSNYQVTLASRITELQSLNEVLKNKLSFLHSLTQLPPSCTVYEKDFPQRYMISFQEPAGGPEEHALAFVKLEWYLNDIAPILASDRVGVFSDERLLRNSRTPVPAYPMLMLDHDESIDSEYIVTIPAGKYLYMYYPDGQLESYHPAMEVMNKYIQDNNYKITGNILQFYKIDVTVTSNPKETLMELQVPVEKV